MYIRLFTSIFSGSLYGKFEPTVTFIAMLALADRAGEVDMVPEAIASKSGFPLSIILAGIEELEKPDPRSRMEAAEGRRILRISDSREWGWRITNFAEYQKIRSAEERREYFREYKAAKRAAERKVDTSGHTQIPPPSTPLDARSNSTSSSTSTSNPESDKKPPAKRASALPAEFVLTDDRKAYADKTLPNVDAAELMAAFRDYHASKGTTAKDWDAAWRTYVRNGLKFGYPMLLLQPKQREKVIRYDVRGNVING